MATFVFKNWIPACAGMTWRKNSGFFLIHQLVLGDPGHHGVELFADFFDQVPGATRACGFAFNHPVAGEASGLTAGWLVIVNVNK